MKAGKEQCVFRRMLQMNDRIKTQPVKIREIRTKLSIGDLKNQIVTPIRSGHMQITGVDDQQIVGMQRVFGSLNDGRKQSFFNI